MNTQPQLAASTLGFAPGSYIYALIPLDRDDTPVTTLAAIASDDAVKVFDARTLKVLSAGGAFDHVHDSVTCLDRYDEAGNVLATAGRDGVVRLWDRRTGGRVLQIGSGNDSKQGLSALAASESRHAIAAGTELEGNGPGDAPIFVWDPRNPSAPQLILAESHTDTITTLSFHPTTPSLLLSGSTDSLISLFDLLQPAEDDALQQVINHRSAIHHGGFLPSSTPTTTIPSTPVFALGTDETLSIHAISNAAEAEAEATKDPEPTLLGDLRQPWGFDYAVGLPRSHSSTGHIWAAVGSHETGHLDLLPFVPRSAPSSKQDAVVLDWNADLGRRVRLQGGHGGEVVRDVVIDGRAGRVWTVGEDGQVRVWGLPADVVGDGEGDVEMEGVEGMVAAAGVGGDGSKEEGKKEGKKSKKEGRKERKKERFRPY